MQHRLALLHLEDVEHHADQHRKVALGTKNPGRGPLAVVNLRLLGRGKVWPVELLWLARTQPPAKRLTLL